MERNIIIDIFNKHKVFLKNLKENRAKESDNLSNSESYMLDNHISSLAGILSDLNKALHGDYEISKTIEPELKKIGTLTKKFGINSYIVADIGHDVFIKGDKYIIILKHTSNLPDLIVPFNKEILSPNIKFD